MRFQSAVLRTALVLSLAVLSYSNPCFARLSTRECSRLLTSQVNRHWIDKMIKRGKETDAQTKRTRDIVQSAGFGTAALNQDILKNHTDKYTTELSMGPITNQAASGRCWIFAGLNMVRSTLIAQGKVPANFEFSESYLYFFSMVEQANRYFENIINAGLEQKEEVEHEAAVDVSKTAASSSPRADEGDEVYGLQGLLTPQLHDGGWYEHFLFLVNKYGLVPKDVMRETRSSESTALLTQHLHEQMASAASEMVAEITEINKLKLSRHQQLKRLRKVKESGMSAVWDILATHLGEPPADFKYRQDGPKTKVGTAQVSQATITKFTPQQFATNFVGFNPNDYVVVWAHPLMEAGSVVEVKDSSVGIAAPGKKQFNMRFMTSGIDRLEQLAQQSIAGGQPVWFAMDMGKDTDQRSGIMHPKIFDKDTLYQLSPEQKKTELTRAIRSFFGLSEPNHAMVLTGFDQPDPSAPVVKFKVENSWGVQAGDRGVYHLYREWFHEHVFQIIVPKKFLNADELKRWESKAAYEVDEGEI